MNRRQFLKWLVSASAFLTSFYLGIPYAVKNLTEPTELANPKAKGKVLAKNDAVHIAILTDLHLQVPTHRGVEVYNQKAMHAIDDMLSMSPDLFVFVGDIVHHGFPEEYGVAKQILNKIHARGIPLFLTMGNHEFYNRKLTSAQAQALFLNSFGQKQIYQNIVKDKLHLVLLSPEYLSGSGRSHDWGRLSNQQLQWFEDVLQQHKDKTTLVFLHQPLNDTVEQSQYTDWIARVQQTDQLLAIAERNPQIKCWFSGHTHAPIGLKNQIVFRHGIWFVGGASTFYTHNIQPIHGSRLGPILGQRYHHQYDFHANQNRFVSIYHDKIEIRARDHTHGEWLNDLKLVVPLTSPQHV